MQRVTIKFPSRGTTGRDTECLRPRHTRVTGSDLWEAREIIGEAWPPSETPYFERTSLGDLVSDDPGAINAVVASD